MDTSTVQETVTQVPAVFCGPTADAAFFVAVAMGVFGLYSIYRLLTRRGSGSILAEEHSSPLD